jgi:uncharacterized protein
MHPLFHPLFVDYCAYFNGNKDYFECHEVLEEYWKEIAPGDKFHPLVGYVQLATGLYHWRRDNFSGASRILTKAQMNFKQNQGSLYFKYIDFDTLQSKIDSTLTFIENKASFHGFALPINNETLLQQTNEKIVKLPPLSQHFIINKHMLRDRSEIIKAREQKKRS